MDLNDKTLAIMGVGLSLPVKFGSTIAVSGLSPVANRDS